jgi:hypothetical protein
MWFKFLHAPKWLPLLASELGHMIVLRVVAKSKTMLNCCDISPLRVSTTIISPLVFKNRLGKMQNIRAAAQSGH